MDEKTIVDKKVQFLDPRHGFWRIGTCYKQEKKVFWVKDVGGRKSKVLSNEIEFLKEEP